MYKLQEKESGFALLVALIVVGVVLSIGLVLLDLSIKQVRLSSNAKESEVSIHAATAGMECARYWRRASSTEMETGFGINPVCFGTAASNNTNSQIVSDPANGDVYQYDYEFTWGATDPRCTQVTAVVASTSVLGNGVTTTNMLTIIPGYTDGNDKYCEAGAKCTVLSVRGYNKPCSGVGTYGTVQREVLLQF